ncbi:ATP phosphoribosyltransferase regulatory subunit [Nicoliella lavandulae]|uniref:ATP phosphoribosyltransferase regulatory subunit n=1 Tax=Nicoliella lavandulae TaxID=3082954 RepID=A0ABU8SMW0_9LACO
MLESVAVPKAAQSSLNELITLAEFAISLPGQSVIIDLSSAAPQQYYTGIIFKGYTTNSNTYIVSGGRYDQLLANFESEIEPAVGLGINIDALASIADVEDSIQRPVFVYAKLPDLRQVVPLIEAHANYSLSLADTLDQAKQQALNAGGRLMIYQPEKGLTEC